MDRYNQLAGMYLKYQKKRTILTVLGVAMAAGALFTILTLYFSNFINRREAIRAEENYEMTFFPETEEQIAGIINEKFIKDAYVGSYYTAYDGSYVNGALFVTVKNPYRINKYFQTICEKYEVEGRINDKLAAYYLQGDIGEETYIIFFMFLFLAVIFSIIGVGIIRNSIQLNTLEQVKDYGVLRCVGATQGQLKSIIFLMGFLQEMAGIAVGMVLGFFAAVVIGVVSGIKVGIHIVPILFVLVAFIGDLFFVMIENSKTVKSMSPLAAVRGTFSVKNRKIKRRGKGIFGRIFGVEGEYAYKSLMANKSRFFKSVTSFGLGISAFIMIFVMSDSVNNLIKKTMESYGEYQYYICVPVGRTDDIDMAKSKMPSYEILEKLAQDDKVEDIKPMYIASLMTANYEAVYDKYNQEYLDETYMGNTIKNIIQGREETPKIMNASIQLIGYDDDDLKAHEELLIEGTLDVSEHGIIVERQVRAFPVTDVDDDISSEAFFGKYYIQNNYKLGDTIDILDFERYNSLVAEKRKEYEDGSLAEIYSSSYRELIETGAYETYTVEGIIEHNIDKANFSELSVIVPLDNYYAMTGLGEADSNGLKYKMSGFSKSAMDLLYSDGRESVYMESSYIYEASAMSSLKKSIRYVAMFIIFIVVMSSVNIINTSASNLHLRRGELAQLRAIGVSKKKLCYIVMLEGIITSITANLLGCVLGFAGLIPLKQATIYMFGIDMTYPLAAAVAGIIISTLILCASIYFPIKRMSNGVLEDLNAGGD